MIFRELASELGVLCHLTVVSDSLEEEITEVRKLSGWQEVAVITGIVIWTVVVGYLTSGDPSYITSHNNARNLILKIDRDELLEEILINYLDLGKK